MKKLLSIVSVLLFTLILGACDEQASDEIKVGFIYIGHVNDGGFTYSHDQGRQYLEEQLDIETKYIENVPEGPESKERMRELIDQGYNVIVANSYGYMDYVEELSSEYPDVKFLHCSGYKTTDNMSNYFGRIYQARYLTGIVAGMKTETDKIGYVAAFPIPEVIRGINAFTLGVKSVNPDATVEVTWTNTWYDPTKERQAADALLDKGIDVISQHQDTPQPLIAAEAKDKWAVGYHSDMDDAAPGAHLVSAIWNWGPYYVSQVEAIQNGTWESGAYWGGLDDEIVDITLLSSNAADGSESLVNEKLNQIKSGDFEVFSGPINDQAGTVKVADGESLTDEELLNMMWFVEGVIGTIPEN